MIDIDILLQILIAFAVFFAVRFFSYWFTEHCPKALMYKPFTCDKCFTFWTMLLIYSIGGTLTESWYFLGLGLLLTVLNVIAMAVAERTQTVSIND